MTEITLAILAISVFLMSLVLRAHRHRLEDLEKNQHPPMTFAEVKMHLGGVIERDVQ